MRPARFPLVIAIASIAFGCASKRQEDPLEKGHAAYERYCALCHGTQGEGYKADGANALAHPEFLATVTDEHLRRAIARGRPGTTMSAWSTASSGPLDDATIDAIVLYLRSWQRTPTQNVHGQKVVGDIARAEPLYATHCKDCHGPRGEAGTEVSIANPELLFTASDGFLRHAIARGRVGTPMAAYSPDLTTQQIDDLVVLIRSWQRPPSGAVVTPPDASAPAVTNPSGGEPVFGDGRFVPVDVVKAQLDKGARMVLLDARPSGDYVFEHIKGAISVPFYDVDKHLARIPKDVFVVAYCACPHAESGTAIDALAKHGYTKLKVLDEGVAVWKARGYPMSAGPKP